MPPYSFRENIMSWSSLELRCFLNHLPAKNPYNEKNNKNWKSQSEKLYGLAVSVERYNSKPYGRLTSSSYSTYFSSWIYKLIVQEVVEFSTLKFVS
ncbi:hypothetical protein DSECCO2_489680 [anaerobic digester metagenome]